MEEPSALVRLAAAHGVRVSDPVVLRDRANLLVHLRPAPVVARLPGKVRALRPDPGHYLATDVAVAGFLAAAGEPVVAPSPELPPGPHRLGDRWCTFWTFTPHTGERAGPDALRRDVDRLHRALRHYPGTLDRGPLADLRFGLDRLPWSDGERAALAAGIDRLADAVAALPAQPLHGDAHAGNALVTAEGPRWTDFEDAWRGPVEWDLACLAHGGTPVGHSPALELCLRLRRVHGALWTLVLRPGDEARRARERLLADVTR